MIKTARKEYDCMACEWLFNDDGIEVSELTFTERRAVVLAHRNKGKILKGEKYLWAKGWNIDTDFKKNFPIVFRAIPEIDAICKRLKIYQYE